MSEETNQVDKSKARMDQCIPIAKEILKLLSEMETPMGDFSEEERQKYYVPIAEKVLDQLTSAGVKYMDVTFVNQLLVQVLENVFAIVSASTDTSLKICHKIKWGKDMMEVSLEDMDEVMKAYQSANSQIEEESKS